MQNFSQEKLKQYVTKIEALEAEKKELQDEISYQLKQAKSDGFDVTVIRQILKIRKMDPNKLYELESLIDTYKHALGMIDQDEAA